MHDTAEKNAGMFFDTYVKKTEDKGPVSIVEIGARAYPGEFLIRNLATGDTNYIGVDFADGYNVDLVLADPYKLPFDNDSIKYVVSSSCFEHAEFFWLTYLEIMRILKPDGLFYLDAPSNGEFHRFPVDCWRFYPDSGNAMVKWGNRNGYKNALIEQYTSEKIADIWEDYVCVFIKDKGFMETYPARITDNFNTYKNGSVYPHAGFMKSNGYLG